MKLSGSPRTTNVDNETISRLISIINTGTAVLFTGAGFSAGAENTLKKSPPLAKKLAYSISKLAGIEKDGDLSYVSDYFLTYKSKSDLLHLLKEHFTILTCKPYHSTISSQKWKRIYTTNYDDCIEKSALIS